MMVLADRFRFMRDLAQAQVAFAMGRHDEALALWAPVASCRATDKATLKLRLQAINSCAQVCHELHRFDEAEFWLRLALELDPAQPGIVRQYASLRQTICAWPIPACDPLLNIRILAATDDPTQHAEAQQTTLGPLQSLLEAGKPAPLHAAQQPRSGKIKVGYLSGDLRMHAVGMLAAELFELHDRGRFEIHAFCWSREDGSPLRNRLKVGFDHFWTIGSISDEAAAQLIARQGIDVLVDLQGLTGGMRPAILVMRPAPVQVSYLGFPGPCGIPGVDWIVADRYVMPAESLPFNTEKPIYLPNCFQVSDRKREVGPTPTRAQCGLPENAFVFCAFNNTFKITEEMFGAWMRVLHAVPGSVLWLLADNPEAQKNMLCTARALGVAHERLIFASRVSASDYLARLALADLFLDTFPYNGGTTANDALWMGVPLLTLSGRSFASRMAGSLLNAVGLPELITTTLADYEHAAITLGNTPERVKAYRRHLIEHGRMSALFDMPRYVRDLENEFERLALEHRAGFAGSVRV